MTDVLDWAGELDDALRRATAGRRFVLADFMRPQCAGCEALEVSFADPAVAAFVREHFIPVRLHLDRREDQPHFQAHRVLWTPTLAVLDRRGVAHYQSPGYLPPPVLLGVLRLGLGRALMGWSRYEEACEHLLAVADDPGNLLAAEALFWLGVANYLRTRRHGDLMQAWSRLTREHPGSAWALRVPPEPAAQGRGAGGVGNP
jgi:hypothetical protein